MALARRRLFVAGLDQPLVEAVHRTLRGLGCERPALLDVGCGEGSMLAELTGRLALDATGVDLSTPSINLAARLLPTATWVVANADRFLPFADQSFDLACSLTARRPAAELARVLRPGGLLLVAVPGPDDLAELRAAVQGKATTRDRLTAAAEALAPHFQLEHHERLTWHADLDRHHLADLLAATYRGTRHREAERFARLAGLRLTLSRDLGVFRQRPC